MIKFIKENWFVMMIGAIVSSIFTQLYLAWCKHNFPKELPAIKDLIAILVVLIIYKKLDSVINYAASKFNSRGQTHLSKIVSIIIRSILLSGIFLFLFDNGNWIADMINFAVAIGTIVLAIFGWMAFKTGKDTYVEQKTLDRASFATIEIVKQILLPIYSLFNTLTIANQKLASCQIAFDADIENCSITSGTIAEYRAVIPLLESAIATVDLFNSRECNYKVELAIIEAMCNSIKLDPAQAIQLSSDLSQFIKTLESFKVNIQTIETKLNVFCALTNYSEQSRYQDSFRRLLDIQFLNDYLNSLPNKTLYSLKRTNAAT